MAGDQADRVFFSVRNAVTGQALARRVAVAADRASRRHGLLGRPGLDAGEGLWIVPSRGVHTCGLRFPIDVVALDAEGRVIDLVEGLRPWRIRLPKPGTVGVLEVAAGAARFSGTRIGHTVLFELYRGATVEILVSPPRGPIPDRGLQRGGPRARPASASPARVARDAAVGEPR